MSIKRHYYKLVCSPLVQITISYVSETVSLTQNWSWSNNRQFRSHRKNIRGNVSILLVGGTLLKPFLPSSWTDWT